MAKQFSTWLKDDLAARYTQHLRSIGMKPYSHIRQLIQIELGVEKAHVIRTQIVFGFLIYGLIASTLIMLRFPIVFISPLIVLLAGVVGLFLLGYFILYPLIYRKKEAEE